MASERERQEKRKVCVIGGGMAGLCCAWLLSQDESCHVTLYETLDTPGLSNASVTVGSKSASSTTGKGDCKDDDIVVDVPQRYFVREYYPTLWALYMHLNVPHVKVTSPTSLFKLPFSANNGRAYFRYENLVLCRNQVSIPWIRPSELLRLDTVRVLLGLWRFKTLARRDLPSGSMDGKTIGAYLREHRFSETFIWRFIAPLFSVVCTCPCKAVLDYPADVIAEWLLCTAPRTSKFRPTHNRVLGGVRQVVAMLLDSVDEVHCATAVHGIESLDGRVAVRVGPVRGGGAESRVHHFDHCVLATQANRALALLAAPSDAHRRILGCFEYASSNVVLHRDISVMPPDRNQWNSMLFALSPDGGSQCMATLWQNTVQDDVGRANKSNGSNDDDGDDGDDDDERPLFQTWNPQVPIEREHIISETWFDRPLITLDTQRAVTELPQIQGAGNIWFCGSYAFSTAIPLLESAALSGLQVAQRINGTPPPFVIPPSKSRAELTVEANRRQLIYTLLILLLAFLLVHLIL
jgi:uncharacterized protein